MSSPDRRALLASGLALLGLGACGFTPAYAPGGPAAGLQGSIRMAEPDDKAGFDFVQRMEERLGRDIDPRYDLTYAINTNTVGIGEKRDNTTTRYNITGTVDWGVVDRASGARLTGGKATNFTSYSATGSTLASLSAQEDAEYRLMRILADQIVTQLTATAGRWAK
ncbi:LPS assembly lipoprotein LptE [Falsirhodobacter sp. 20TX0035]|uniref:LPS assembly lipoprotein LptE n=1 Tax=Falsirhodobacter sp. 20TX0035 TaxID=3022019 RepID=UPI00232D3B56|nr:LPS assembly lipoprotein LptE [Falsirhodobacter sp. 20TX0035]MDB6452555.1 LPS assembly lipoprotein LptE [Falsirhodobacter sp. 20TX0035]